MQKIWFCVSTRYRKYRTIDWLTDDSKAQKMFCAFLFSFPHRFSEDKAVSVAENRCGMII